MNILKHLKWIMPLMPLTLNFADGDGGDGGDGNGGGDGNEDKGETVSKVDFEKVSGERDKLTKDIDDVRAEIFTPDYMAFLDAKDKPQKDKDGDGKDKGGEDISTETLDKMSNKDILALATKNALESMQKVYDTDKSTRKTDTDAATAREIQRFANAHSDYEQYRPIMYGISLLPKNKGDSLQELYDKAKGHVKSLQTEPTKEEKEKQNASDGMKPGTSSGTYTSEKRVDADTAAKEAAEETAAKYGPIPLA